MFDYTEFLLVYLLARVYYFCLVEDCQTGQPLAQSICVTLFRQCTLNPSRRSLRTLADLVATLRELDFKGVYYSCRSERGETRLISSDATAF